MEEHVWWAKALFGVIIITLRHPLIYTILQTKKPGRKKGTSTSFK